MPTHLTLAMLNALADAEFSPDALLAAQQHLADCPACTSAALTQSLLKSATARAGLRYTPPPHLRARLLQSTPHRPTWPLWAAAAILLLTLALVTLHRPTALPAEVADLHLATLAAGLPPQVVSSDRHTVKPWFQGKLPFAFNLPTNLPADTTLDGANLTYLHAQPTAQLLFSIGRHRVSIFLQQPSAAAPQTTEQTEDVSGFHILAARTPNLQILAVSDADPTRLAQLLTLLQQAN